MPPLTRIRTVPWLVLFELARTTKAHLDERLTDKDRRRVAEILRATKGDVRKLSDRERADLRRIAGRLDIPGLARSVAPTATRLRRRR
jgi:hypothetical protein